MDQAKLSEPTKSFWSPESFEPPDSLRRKLSCRIKVDVSTRKGRLPGSVPIQAVRLLLQPFTATAPSTFIRWERGKEKLLIREKKKGSALIVEPGPGFGECSALSVGKSSSKIRCRSAQEEHHDYIVRPSRNLISSWLKHMRGLKSESC